MEKISLKLAQSCYSAISGSARRKGWDVDESDYPPLSSQASDDLDLNTKLNYVIWECTNTLPPPLAIPHTRNPTTERARHPY